MPSVVVSVSADEVERCAGRRVEPGELDDILTELSELVNSQIEESLEEAVNTVMERR